MTQYATPQNLVRHLPDQETRGTQESDEDSMHTCSYATVAPGFPDLAVAAAR